MALPKEVWPLLKEQNLVAFAVNEGWVIVRRKTFFDLFIEDQPFNSVEVLFHSASLVSWNIDMYRQSNEGLLFSHCSGS